MKPIIVDPGLYLSEKSEMFYATQKRDLPNSFRLFTGVFSSIVLIVLLDAFCTELIHMLFVMGKEEIFQCSMLTECL